MCMLISEGDLLPVELFIICICVCTCAFDVYCTSVCVFAARATVLFRFNNQHMRAWEKEENCFPSLKPQMLIPAMEFWCTEGGSFR